MSHLDTSMHLDKSTKEFRILELVALDKLNGSHPNIVYDL